MLQDKILVTGYSGFVGKALVKVLPPEKLVLVGRRNHGDSESEIFNKRLDSTELYAECFAKVSVVIHMAARVHVMQDNLISPLEEFRSVNVAGTLNLAKQAAISGVKRFIFISSIKVNGESTSPGSAFRYDDIPQPKDAYGISKTEAEAGLRLIAADTGMEIVIIRPPLVYGRGVKANFAAMLALSKKNLPLPLGAINNRRSLVALNNLVDLIVTCIDNPNAANQTFLVSDDNDLSTTDLLKMMTKAVGKNPRLFPVPTSWLRLAGKLTGKEAIINRLCDNLQVDISHTKQTLGWTPPLTVEQGIAQCFEKEDLC